MNKITLHSYLKAVIAEKNVQDVWSLLLGKVTCPELPLSITK